MQTNCRHQTPLPMLVAGDQLEMISRYQPVELPNAELEESQQNSRPSTHVRWWRRPRQTTGPDVGGPGGPACCGPGPGMEKLGIEAPPEPPEGGGPIGMTGIDCDPGAPNPKSPFAAGKPPAHTLNSNHYDRL